MGICFYLWFRTLVINLIMQDSFVSAWADGVIGLWVLGVFLEVALSIMIVQFWHVDKGMFFEEVLKTSTS